MKKIAIEIKWGITFFAAILLWAVLEKLTGLHSTYIDKHMFFTNLFALVAILIYVLALIEKRKRFYNNSMTWLQGFVSGLTIAVIVAILSPLGQVLTHSYLSPDYFPNVIAYSVNSGELTQAEAEAYFSLRNYIKMSIVGAIVMGSITSAIVAIFTRRS